MKAAGNDYSAKVCVCIFVCVCVYFKEVEDMG